MSEGNYLTNIPDNVNTFGFCKTLAVRREVIHIKHIFTEVFTRKTIDIEKYLNKLNITLFEYMEIMTNRIRKVHYFSRLYDQNCNDIVKKDRDRFFPTMELLQGLSILIVLDFDGVTTANKFKELYELCCERENVQICTANPTVNNEWFDNHKMTRPNNINAMKGKVKKIKRLIELQKKYDYVFYVDNEIEYLEYAWLFGLQTYHWNGTEIKYFSLKSK